MYRIANRTAATAATAGTALFGIWNPHASLRMRTAEIAILATTAPTAGAGLAVRRSTARGTVTTSSTPTIDNDVQRAQIATSGATLDVTYSAQPTLAAAVLFQWSFAAAAGSGLLLPLELSIPPGTGLAFVNIGAFIFPASDVSVAWREEF